MTKELPILACELDADGARDQARRYAAVAPHVSALERDDHHLVATLDARVDTALVGELVEIERACCAFFEIGWEAGERRLSFAVGSPDHAPALDVIAQALGA